MSLNESIVSLNESIVETVVLEWFGELGYGVGHGPQLAPGELAAERKLFGEVVLVGRRREAIRQLTPAIPEDAAACAWLADRRAVVADFATVQTERNLDA